MCGRTALSLTKEQVQCACSYKNNGLYQKPDWIPEHNAGNEYKPSYNITPTEVTPVLMPPGFDNNASCTSRVLKPMVWGVVPPWHQGDHTNHGLSTHNCRLENIQQSKLYGPLLRKGNRCVVVVEGYYEWDTKRIVKKPYYIYAPQEGDIKIDDRTTWTDSWDAESGWKGIKLLHMAAVYNLWTDSATGTVVYSYAVITTKSDEGLSWLHTRMPVVLKTEEQINNWLNVNEVEAKMALQYLRPTNTLLWHPVSTAVNKSSNKSAECIKKMICKKQMTVSAWLVQPNKRKEDSHSQLQGPSVKIKK